MKSLSIILCITLSVIESVVYAQSVTLVEDSAIGEAARVYLDCQYCDQDYIKTEITFVSFVRDRAEADVHILVTRLSTGAGGYEYTSEFIGKRAFANSTDTLKTFTLESDSDDKIRTQLVRTFKLGLIRFVARTPLGKEVTISYSKPAFKTDKIDKWKGWVFSISTNSYFNGEKSSRYLNLNGNLQIRRVSEMNRITLNFYGNYNESRYSYDDYQSSTFSRSRGAEITYLFGLDDHWSLGIGSETFMSSYSNYDNAWEFYPTCEYNVFPYSQATRKQLRIQYAATLRYNDYETKTIYERTSEWFGISRLSVNLEFTQPWGSMEIWSSGNFHFDDFSKRRLEVGGELEWKLFKGLSLTMNGTYSQIHDQLNLAKGDVSLEEILDQRRQLATSYSYWGSIGLRYSFGSIYSNVVNPRFGY